MTKAEQIRERIKALAGDVGPLQTLICKVVSVNEDELTCIVDEDGVEIPDVRLQCVLNGKEGTTIIPKAGCFCLIVRLEDDAEWMLLAADEIDKYRITAGTMLFEMKQGKFMIKSGSENLGKCIDDLIEQIQLIYAPKNAAAITAIQLRFKQLLDGA